MKSIAVIISRICGVNSSLFGLAFLWTAVNKSPWFQWTEEELSILGVYGSATVFFNWSLILSGLFSMVFALGLSKSLPLHKSLQNIGVLSLAFGSLALALAGIIPRIEVVPHNITSGAFFTLTPFGIFLLGLFFIKSYRLPWGLFSMSAAIMMIGIQLAPWPWQGGAIPQLLSSLMWSLWTFVMAISLLIKPQLITK